MTLDDAMAELRTCSARARPECPVLVPHWAVDIILACVARRMPPTPCQKEVQE